MFIQFDKYESILNYIEWKCVLQRACQPKLKLSSAGRSLNAKKPDGVKESTDSSATIDDDDNRSMPCILLLFFPF